MDIFNRKKLAAAEAEIERLEKACAKFHTDISEAENKAERYKRERDEARSNIGKQVAQNGELTKSLSELRYLKGQKEKDEQALKSEIEELNNKLKEAEVTNSALKLCLEQSEDIEVIEDDNRTENAAYIIRNELVEGKICDNKKTRYKFVSSLYKSCKSLFSQSELKFYEMLSDLAQKKGLFCFLK